jgi:hypothetical protein
VPSSRGLYSVRGDERFRNGPKAASRLGFSSGARDKPGNEGRETMQAPILLRNRPLAANFVLHRSLSITRDIWIDRPLKRPRRLTCRAWFSLCNSGT